MPSPIHEQLIDLESSLDQGGDSDSDSARTRGLVKRVQDLYQLLKVTEATHVTNGLKDLGFGFEAAQDELGQQRMRFAIVVRKLTRAWRLDGLVRRNLRDLAYLMESAPLSTLEDLDAIRAARAARKRRRAAPVQV
jgi:hypothetical protein